MLEGRDANCGHSQQYLSVPDRWFRRIGELQPSIATEFFRSLIARISVSVSLRCLIIRHVGLQLREIHLVIEVGSQRSDVAPGDLLVVRVGTGRDARTCERGCFERRESAGVRAEVAQLEDSIPAHLEQSQMFGIRELLRRSNVGARRILNEYDV